jgi:hypothetical protein
MQRIRKTHSLHRLQHTPYGTMLAVGSEKGWAQK